MPIPLEQVIRLASACLRRRPFDLNNQRCQTDLRMRAGFSLPARASKAWSQTGILA